MTFCSAFKDRVKFSPDWRFKVRAELSKARDYDECTGHEYFNLEHNKTLMNQVFFSVFCIDL